MAHHGNRSCADDDHSGHRPVLWRTREKEKHAQRYNAEPLHSSRYQHHMGCLRLQPRVRIRIRRKPFPLWHRRIRQGDAQRHKPRHHHYGRHTRTALRHVPVHVRRHNARPHPRSVRRAREVLGLPDVHNTVERVRIYADGALGMGRRMAK